MLLPLPALVAVSLIVLGAMLAGFAGPPARRPHPRLAWTLFAIGLGVLGLSAGVLFPTSSPAASLTAAAAACILALSARFLREPGGGDDPPRGSGDPWTPPDPGRPDLPDRPWSWDDFDRARARWSQDRAER